MPCCKFIRECFSRALTKRVLKMREYLLKQSSRARLALGCARHAHYQRRGIIPATLYMCRARIHFALSMTHGGREAHSLSHFWLPSANDTQTHIHSSPAANEERKLFSYNISSPFLLIKRALSFSKQVLVKGRGIRAEAALAWSALPLFAVGQQSHKPFCIKIKTLWCSAKESLNSFMLRFEAFDENATFSTWCYCNIQ